MYTTQKGSTGTILLAVISLAAFSYFALQIISDSKPARAEHIQELVERASQNSEATAILHGLLKKTPKPDQAELRAMDEQINEILVEHTVRAVIGNETSGQNNDAGLFGERYGAWLRFLSVFSVVAAFSYVLNKAIPAHKSEGRDTNL